MPGCEKRMHGTAVNTVHNVTSPGECSAIIAKVCEAGMPITISCIVPVYNAELYLRKTLHSLLCQKELPAEILIIDDGSRDNTCEIAAEAAKRDRQIRVFSFSTNNGVSAARNFGLQAAYGDWILFLDGDDIADANLISRQLQRIRQLAREGYGDIILVHSAYQQIDVFDKAIGGSTRWKQVEPKETVGYFLLRNPIITASGVLARKDALLATGGFNRALRYAEDWDLWLRLAQMGSFGYVDDPLVFVRRHDNNASRSVATMLEGEMRVLSQYSMEFIETAIFRRNLPWEVNAADYSGLLFRMGEWDKGYSYLERVLSHNASFVSGKFLMGLFYTKQQRWEKAQRYFEQTLALDERHGSAMNNLGVTLALKGQFEEALRCFQRAMVLFPGYLDARKNKELLLQIQSVACSPGDFHFTWRELRPVLLSYSE